MPSVSLNLEWKVSEDRLQVLAKKPSQPGRLPDLEEFTEFLKSQDISAAIDENAFKSLESSSSEEWIMVARGTPPTEPIAGRLEYYVDPSLIGQRGSGDEKTKVDHKDLKRILNVEKGQPLVRKHDPVPGEPGVDVYGEPIPPRDPPTTTIPVGEGVEIVENGRLAIAAADGAITARGNRICITDRHVVIGNVSYKTGNIDFKGSVEISGDVQAGFEVCAEGDVSIDGMVEAANVNAGGDITIGGGFQGGGRGSLVAGGSIRARFANEGSLQAGENVFMTTSITNCDVGAVENVEVESERGVIAGGQVRAGTRIKSGFLGTDLGVKTVVQIGLNDELADLIVRIEEEIEKSTKRLGDIQEVLMLLQEIKENTGDLTSYQEKIRIKAVRGQFLVMGKMDKANKDLVSRRAEQDRARSGSVEVKQIAYPGVMIKFPGYGHSVKNRMRRSVFYFEKGEIKSRDM